MANNDEIFDFFPDPEQLFWRKNRVKTFKNWPFSSKELKCNPEKMAMAGFYCIGGDEEPDLVECFICGKQLDGWEATDDPWLEHKKHKADCAFVKLNKQIEQQWTIEELYKLVKEYVILNMKKKKDQILKKYAEHVSEQEDLIPELFKKNRSIPKKQK